MVGSDSLAVTRREMRWGKVVTGVVRAVGFLGGLGMQSSISEQTRTTVSNFPTVSIGFPGIKTKTKGAKKNHVVHSNVPRDPQKHWSRHFFTCQARYLRST